MAEKTVEIQIGLVDEAACQICQLVKPLELRAASDNLSFYHTAVIAGIVLALTTSKFTICKPHMVEFKGCLQHAAKSLDIQKVEVPS